MGFKRVAVNIQNYCRTFHNCSSKSLPKHLQSSLQWQYKTAFFNGYVIQDFLISYCFPFCFFLEPIVKEKWSQQENNLQVTSLPKHRPQNRDRKTSDVAKASLARRCLLLVVSVLMFFQQFILRHHRISDINVFFKENFYNFWSNMIFFLQELHFKFKYKNI